MGSTIIRRRWLQEFIDGEPSRKALRWAGYLGLVKTGEGPWSLTRLGQRWITGNRRWLRSGKSPEVRKAAAQRCQEARLWELSEVQKARRRPVQPDQVSRPAPTRETGETHPRPPVRVRLRVAGTPPDVRGSRRGVAAQGGAHLGERAGEGLPEGRLGDSGGLQAAVGHGQHGEVGGSARPRGGAPAGFWRELRAENARRMKDWA